MSDFTIFILIYIISAIACWYVIKLFYTHVCRGMSPSVIDIVIVLVPVVNTVGAIVIMFHVLRSSRKSKSYARKFFRLNQRRY